MAGWLEGFKTALTSKTVLSSLAAFIFALFAVLAPELDLSRAQQIVSGILSMFFNGTAIYGRMSATKRIVGILPPRVRR